MPDLSQTTIDNVFKGLGIMAAVWAVVHAVFRPFADQQLIRAAARNTDAWDRLLLQGIARLKAEMGVFVRELLADELKQLDSVQKIGGAVTDSLANLTGLMQDMKRDNSEQTTNIASLGREVSEIKGQLVTISAHSTPRDGDRRSAAARRGR